MARKIRGISKNDSKHRTIVNADSPAMGRTTVNAAMDTLDSLEREVDVRWVHRGVHVRVRGVETNLRFVVDAIRGGVVDLIMLDQQANEAAHYTDIPIDAIRPYEE